jgi:hypothetical protein
MLRAALAFSLLALAGVADSAVAQTCVQDRNGRVVCGNQVGPYYGPATSPYYGPQVDRNSGNQAPSVGAERRFACPAGSRLRNGVCR